MIQCLLISGTISQYTSQRREYFIDGSTMNIPTPKGTQVIVNICWHGSQFPDSSESGCDGFLHTILLLRGVVGMLKSKEKRIMGEGVSLGKRNRKICKDVVVKAT